MKANIDISHLVLSRVPAEEMRRLRGRVGHVHLSDCDGKVHGDLPPGRGVVPFEPYLREIKNLDLGDGAISIELEYSPEPDADRRVGRRSLSRDRQADARPVAARLSASSRRREHEAADELSREIVRARTLHANGAGRGRSGAGRRRSAGRRGDRAATSA